MAPVGGSALQPASGGGAPSAGPPECWAPGVRRWEWGPGGWSGRRRWEPGPVSPAETSSRCEAGQPGAWDRPVEAPRLWRSAHALVDRVVGRGLSCARSPTTIRPLRRAYDRRAGRLRQACDGLVEALSPRPSRRWGLNATPSPSSRRQRLANVQTWRDTFVTQCPPFICTRGFVLHGR